jgi:hypothetical protein
MRIGTLQSVALAALFSLVGGNSIAEAPINARSYQCQELKQLVADKGRVYLKGILGTKSSVYASPGSCNEIHEVAVRSAWRTKDVFSCVVGYRCLPRIDLENRLGFGSD